MAPNSRGRNTAQSAREGSIIFDSVARSAIRKDLGVRLREWRLQRGMSQADVARRAGITQASLSNYEAGKRDMPLSTFLGVASALNVSLGDLLELPDVIVIRDSSLGRAVERWRDDVSAGHLTVIGSVHQ